MESIRTTSNASDSDTIDLGALFRHLLNGLPKTLGLALLGLVIAVVLFLIYSPYQSIDTSTRVVFSFAGYERGEYPDKSKFQPDDLRSPDIIATALEHQGLETSANMQSRVRAALGIEGLISPSIIKERDRLRAAGQTTTTYMPDEYKVTLSLPRKFPLNIRQRELLLSEIISVYGQKFQQAYVALPISFGDAFHSLEGADYPDYELVLNRESQNMASFLEELSQTAKSFRSQSTNLSFGDLYKQNQLFTQIRLNQTLGLIRQNGLAKDRSTAMLKMEYYLQTLDDQEKKATEEEKLVQGLLSQTQERTQSYVLGAKSMTQQRSDSPLIDQGLINSLLANDAYNFLVRKALDIGLITRQIQSEKAILIERKRNMQDFIDSKNADQKSAITQLQQSLDELKIAYNNLFELIRKTHEDYQRQKFGDAIRISMQAQTTNYYLGLAMAAIIGLLVGAVFGLALSLLSISTRQPEKA